MILLGRGEYNRLSISHSAQADLLEAVIGVIYMEAGLSETKRIVLRWLDKFMLDENMDLWNEENLNYYDAKSRLQEKFLSEFQIIPTYEVTFQDPEFQASLMHNGKAWATSSDTSKKRAIEKLAQFCINEKIWEKIKESLC